MVSTKTELGNPLGTDQGTQILIPSQTQLSDQDCKDIYLQLAVIAQSYIPDSETLDTYEALYQLGCDDPEFSRTIDETVADQLRLCTYSLEERFRFLYQGAYIQSQMKYHYLSEEGGKNIVRKLLEKQQVQRLPRQQSLPSTTAA